MPDLTSAERHILTERYVQYRQVTSIAAELGLSLPALRDLEMAAIRKLGLTYSPTPAFDAEVRAALQAP